MSVPRGGGGRQRRGDRHFRPKKTRPPRDWLSTHPRPLLPHLCPLPAGGAAKNSRPPPKFIKDKDGTERWVLDELLGAGSFGLVYSGFDKKRNERVAIKLEDRHSRMRKVLAVEVDIYKKVRLSAPHIATTG